MPTDLDPSIETAEFAPTKLELWNLYNRLALSKSWIAMLTVSVAGGAVVAMSRPVPDFRDGVMFAGLVLLLVLMLVPILHWQRISGKAQANLYARRRLRFTATGLQAENDRGATSETPYANFWRATRTLDGLLLYVTKGMFVFVPYRAFRSPTEIEAVQTLLRQHRLMK